MTVNRLRLRTPQYLMLGQGNAGEKPHLDNVTKNFDKDRTGGCLFFSDLIVGRE